MTQIANDTATMALKLAEAKKPCPHGGMLPHGNCPLCNGAGEVYVLGPEVRVKCKLCRGTGVTCSMSIGNCQGRGWNPLDPRYGWDWMVALAQVDCRLSLYPPSGRYSVNQKWYAGIRIDGGEEADTPGEAFFTAACLALDTEKE